MTKERAITILKHYMSPRLQADEFKAIQVAIDSLEHDYERGFKDAKKEFKSERVTLIQEIHDLVFRQGKEIAIKPILQHIKDNNYNSPLTHWIDEYAEGIINEHTTKDE